MKKVIFIGLLWVSALVNSSFGQLIDHPKSSLILQFKQEDGTNGAAVAYNPIKELYYAVIAGNGDFPIEVFDVNGNNLYQTNAGNDLRGIWWNPSTKALEGNGYGDIGLVSFAMDNNGFPSLGSNTIYEGGNTQPNGQSVGVLDTKKKQVAYYSEGAVYWYKRANGAFSKKLNLTLGSTASINEYSMIYTGVKKMEIGLLDFENNKIYLFNSKNGTQTATITLPKNAIASAAFKFSYANKHVFLYDIDSRSWTGFRIFM